MGNCVLTDSRLDQASAVIETAPSHVVPCIQVVNDNANWGLDIRVSTNHMVFPVIGTVVAGRLN